MVLSLTAILVAVSVTNPIPPECPPCDVELEHVVTLGREGDQGYVGHPTQVLASGNKYYVVIEDDPAFVRVCASDGAFLRLIGGIGKVRRQYFVGPPRNSRAILSSARLVRRAPHRPRCPRNVRYDPLACGFARTLGGLVA